jgi:heme o synthase
MATDPILIIIVITIITARQELEPARGHAGAIRSVVADYWALTKPEVNFLIAVATFSGFYLAYPSPVHDFPWLRLVHTLIGTLLVAGGTGALNQYVERRFDAQMRRTARRPLAAGRLKPWAVLWFGIALASVGSIYLATTVNLLPSLLAIATLLAYLFLYTALKRETPLCTLIGAFPGAVPPLIGCAAASGTLTVEAWIIYAMLFLWQFPHFMAIGWMYREDYDRAGYLVLPSGKARISFVTWQTILPLLALLPVSLLVASGGQPGIPSRIGTLLLSLGFVYYGAQFVLRRSNAAARRLLLASIIYLPSLLILIVLLRGWRTL